MSVAPLPRVRRVVTATDAEGRSFIAEDGPSPAGFALPGSPFRSDNLWRTGAAPAPVDAPDSIVAHRGVQPEPGGTVIRAIDFQPQTGTREEQRALAGQVFAMLYPMPSITPIASDRQGCTRRTPSITRSCSRARSGRCWIATKPCCAPGTC